MKREGLRDAIGRSGVRAQLGLENHNGVTDKVQQVETKATGPIESHGSLNEKVKDWADHQDDLSTDHRGIKQFKGVRTAEWMTGEVRDALTGVASHFHREPKASTMEKEA